MRSEKDPRILKLTLTERKAQQTLLPFSFVQCQLQDVTHFDSFKWQQVRLAGSLCVSLTSSIRTQLYFGKDPVHHGSPLCLWLGDVKKGLLPYMYPFKKDKKNGWLILIFST